MPTGFNALAAILTAMPLFLHAQDADLCPRLQTLLGRPYADDAVTDERGRTVTFSHSDRTLPSPALNCSGFMVEAARRLLGFHGSPLDAARDRHGDSGPDAPFGKDWDFGFDLALNLSEGKPHRWITLEGFAEADHDAAQLKGWRFRDRDAWNRALASFPTGHVGLAVLYRGTKPGQLRFHHVAVVLKDWKGRAWFYQTLPKGRVHRLELNTPGGFARLCEMFGPGERVVLLDVEAIRSAHSP